MARKFNLKSKSLWKKIGLVALSCALFVGSIAGLSALFKKAEETTKEINPTYSVGALDATTGKYVETKSAIYTKDGIECQGLTTSLEFDAVVKYQLFFYGEYDNFIHTTGTLDGVFYSTDVPASSRYVRIVIIPNEDENISWLEKNKYSNQLNVEVNKEQNFKSIGENLFKIADDIEPGNKLDTGDGKTLIEMSGYYLTSLIPVNNEKHSLFINDMALVDGKIALIYFYDKNNNFLNTKHLSTDHDGIYHVSTGKYYYSCDLSSNVGYFRVFLSDGVTPEIYVF